MSPWSKPVDLFAVVAMTAAVIWLDLPKLFLPAILLTLFGLSIYRWRRDGQSPAAAARLRPKLLALTMVTAAVSVPLILELVPPNGVYGFRNALTRSSEDIWYSANAFMGRALLAGAIIGGVAVLRLPQATRRAVLVAAVVVPMVGAVLASVLYLQRFA